MRKGNAKCSEKARLARKRIIREAADALKVQLAMRFENIYDAYSFFDLDGDWNLTVNEFLVGLRRVFIDTKTLEREFAHNRVGLLRTLDKHNTSVIDVKAFISMLAWHPRHSSWSKALEASRENAKKIRERTEEMLEQVRSAQEHLAALPLAGKAAPRDSTKKISSWRREHDADDEREDESPSPQKKEDVREVWCVSAFVSVFGVCLRLCLFVPAFGSCACVSARYR